MSAVSSRVQFADVNLPPLHSTSMPFLKGTSLFEFGNYPDLERQFDWFIRPTEPARPRGVVFTGNIQPQWWSWICRCSNLNSVEISNAPALTDTDILKLATLSGVEILRLNALPRISGKGIAQLLSQPTWAFLQQLECRNFQISDEVCEQMARLPQLAKVKLLDCS
ncbi:MAG: hypothetical protein KGQ49_00785, partial [Verrucomicrobia bacterium]|nr:hypothetical protein [Verrucomicrobiota bacterium]